MRKSIGIAAAAGIGMAVLAGCGMSGLHGVSGTVESVGSAAVGGGFLDRGNDYRYIKLQGDTSVYTCDAIVVKECGAVAQGQKITMQVGHDEATEHDNVVDSLKYTN